MNYRDGTMRRQSCLKKIKKKFTKEPILKIYQPMLPTKVEMDTSDFVLGACPLQKHGKI